jgi:hypothetical protein
MEIRALRYLFQGQSSHVSVALFQPAIKLCFREKFI